MRLTLAGRSAVPMTVQSRVYAKPALQLVREIEVIKEEKMNFEWRPVGGHILTRWGKGVAPENAWLEYPRPQMRRAEWLNLNGLWEYGITSRKQHNALKFEGKILVPFALEAALSGVGRGLQPDERLWYRRTFSIPPGWEGQRILLHFGAVDWEATIWVNGQEIGKHRGGYLPFWFDITGKMLEGENELVLSVWDPTDTSWQQHGKQTLKPKGIWYTAVSGIWQTVWLEPVPETYIDRLKITPDIDSQSVTVEVLAGGAEKFPSDSRVQVFDEGTLVAEAHIAPAENRAIVQLQNQKLWSPDFAPFI